MAKKLDLLIINPATGEKIYQDLSRSVSALEPPWYAASTASFARRKGFGVEIVDANAEGISMEETAERARSLNPRLINIIAYGQQPSDSAQRMAGILSQCSEIKRIGEGLPIAVTGLYPSYLPEKTLREVPCDFVGQGEGFLTVLGLLENGPLERIPGLAWKENGKIVLNPKAGNIQDLDKELPIPAWDLLPMVKYRAHNWHCLEDIESRQPYASIYTSLGCPFSCSFCCISSPFGGPGIRYWNQESVIGQLDWLVKNHGVKNVKFIDEMFVLNKKRVSDISELLTERDYDLNIWAYARVDTVNDSALLDRMKQAGFKWLALGIESGSKHVRDGVEKGRFGEEKIIENVRRVQNAGINIIGNFIFGLPDDTTETMRETLDLARELNCEWANFYSAMAYPGSALYTHAKTRGIPLPDDSGIRGCVGYSQHAYETLPLPTDTLTAAEVLRFRDNAHLAYFSDPSYLGMVERKFGLKAANHVREMNTIKLKRRILGD